jgi:hypothetical protein
MTEIRSDINRRMDSARLWMNPSPYDDNVDDGAKRCDDDDSDDYGNKKPQALPIETKTPQQDEWYWFERVDELFFRQGKAIDEEAAIKWFRENHSPAPSEDNEKIIMNRVAQLQFGKCPV